MNPAAGPPAGILLPKPKRLFLQRALRLRDLAATVPGLSGYLLLLAELTERQADIVDAPASGLSTVGCWQRGAEGDPTDALQRGPALTPILKALVQDFEAPSAPVNQALARIVWASDADVETWVIELRMGQPAPEHSAVLPFVAAALQIERVCWAAERTADDLGGPAEPGLCPLCHGWPVVSVLRTVGDTPGLRYLHCGFCASEWPYPRIQCIQCGSGEHIAYHAIEGADPAIQAETCDACHVYLKRIDRDKSPGADPLADDIATLSLDVLLNEQGYQRFGFNPLLLTPA